MEDHAPSSSVQSMRTRRSASLHSASVRQSVPCLFSRPNIVGRERPCSASFRSRGFAPCRRSRANHPILDEAPPLPWISCVALVRRIQRAIPGDLQSTGRPHSREVSAVDPLRLQPLLLLLQANPCVRISRSGNKSSMTCTSTSHNSRNRNRLRCCNSLLCSGKSA
jgi:hypothetical protein